MQSVHGSLSVKTLALAAAAAGGDSESKKTRNRRSKEERKTLVESFIQKYQKINNGKFPSLNLTHKEVGGSFYTVREIVREVIQENRVLAPGNLNSKALNLAYYPEEEDISTPMSIATIDYTTDQEQGDGFSFAERDNVNSTHSKIFEVGNDSVHQTFRQESKPNVTIVSQQVSGEKYDYQDSKLDDGTIGKQPKLGNELAAINENMGFISAQISGNAKHSLPSCEAMVEVIDNNGNQSNSKVPITNSLSATNVLPVPDKLPETNLLVGSVSEFSSSIEIPTISDINDKVKEEFVPFEVDSVNNRVFTCQKTQISNVGNGAAAACPDTQTSFEQDSVENSELSKNIKGPKCSSEQVSGNIDHSAPSFNSLVNNLYDNGDVIDATTAEISSLSSSEPTRTAATSPETSLSSKSVLNASTSHKASKTCYFVDVKEVMLPGVDLNVNNISESVPVSSDLGDETLAASHGTQHSCEHDPFTGNKREKTDVSSRIAANEASNENLNLSALPSFESKDLESMGSVVRTSLHADNTGNVVTKRSDEANQLKIKVDKNDCYNNECITNTKSIPRQSLPRQSLHMESEKTTENPFWAAIKSIIDAVSKFWSE